VGAQVRAPGPNPAACPLNSAYRLP
jgi:hypothetical protein